MLFFSRIASYQIKETSEWKVGNSIKDTVSYQDLKEFHQKYPIERVSHKHGGLALAPYRCNDAADLAAVKKMLDEKKPAGVTLECKGDKDKTWLLMKGTEIKWRCDLNRFDKARRVDTNVSKYGSVILDFDEYDPATSLLDRINAALSALGWAAVIQSSYSHGTYREGRGNKQGYHVFLQLDKEVKKTDWLGLFASIEAEFAKHGAVVDGTTTDYSRLYFGVCQNSNDDSHWMWEYREGTVIDTAPLIAAGASVVRVREHKETVRKEVLAKANGIVLAEDENPLSKITWDDFDAELLFDHLGIKYGTVKNAPVGSGHDYTMRYHCTEDHGGADDAVCSFSPGKPPMIYCSHFSCPIGKGDGSTKRFFKKHWDKLPASMIIDGVYTFKRKPRPVIVEIKTQENEVELPAEPELGQAKHVDILAHYRSSVRAIAVVAPTGSGKTTANAAYSLECMLKGDKVLYVCSTKAEMEQFKQTINNTAPEAIKNRVHYHQADDMDIPSTSLMIVTHHHFLMRAGMMNGHYPVVDWAEKAVVIVDETDALMMQMAKAIPVTTRVTKSHNGEIRYVGNCPSASSNRYRCEDCQLCEKIPMKSFHGKIWTTEIPMYPMDDYTFNTPIKCDPTATGLFSDTTDPRLMSKGKMHKLRVSKINKPQRFQPTTVMDNDNIPKYTQASEWLATVIAESEEPTLVSTNEDLRDIFRQAYSKFYMEHTPDPESNDQEKDARAYANKQMNIAMKGDKLRSYPIHTCGVQEMHYLDTFVFKKVINGAKCVRYSTGTLSDRKKKVLNKIHGAGNEPSYISVENTTFVPIKKLSVLLVENTLTHSDIKKIYQARENSADMYDGVKIGKNLIILPTIGACDGLGTIMKDAAVYKHSEARASVFEPYQGGIWETLITYGRSPLGRGMNLGDYSSVMIDSSIFKPMYSYDFHSAANLLDVQEEERISFEMQNSGRILRMPMHVINGKWETVDAERVPWANDRVIIIHGVENFRKSKEMMLAAWQSLVETEIQFIEIDEMHNLAESDDRERVLHCLQLHWNHLPICAKPFIIPEDFFKVEYSRACRKHRNYDKLVTKVQHDEVRKRLDDMEWYRDVTSKSYNSVREFKRQIHLDRKAPTLSQKILELLEVFMSKIEVAKLE